MHLIMWAHVDTSLCYIIEVPVNIVDTQKIMHTRGWSFGQVCTKERI